MAISLPDKGMTRVSRDDEGLDLGGRAQVKRHGGESFFAGPISPTASTQRRPLSARASSEDTGRQGTAQERQQAAHLQGSWCGAPRTSTLLRAVQRGDYEGLVKLLGLANGEQEESADSRVLGALLTEASGREHLDCIELLLGQMTRRSKRKLKRQGYFPMHTAARAGAIESIELLISAGMSPKTRDYSGLTPLHHASANGSVNSVSLLCAIARSTIVARDKKAGDTPLHFAVRARHAVCVDVLVSHAGTDIVRETNAAGKTPLDVARMIGDNKILWALEDGNGRRHGAASATSMLQSRYRPFGGRTGARMGLDGGIDIDRIMAVWERFFENAARVCLGSNLAKDLIYEGDAQEYQHCQPRKPTSADEKEQGHDMHQQNNNPTTVDAGERTGGLIATRGGGDEQDGRAANPNHEKNEHRVPHKSDASSKLSIPYKAWMFEPLDHARNLGEATDCPLHDNNLRETEASPVQLSNDGDETPYSEYVGLSQSPRSDGGDRGWSTVTNQGTVHSVLELTTRRKDGNVVTAGNSTPDQAWVACWDAASESVYYWNSESGDLTWNAPAVPDGVGFPSRVWDPQGEAFFIVDEWGGSHWLDGTFLASTKSTDHQQDYAGATVAATDYQPGHEGRPSSQLHELKVWPSSKGNDACHLAVGGEDVWPSGKSWANNGGDNHRCAVDAHAEQIVKSQHHRDSVYQVSKAQQRDIPEFSLLKAGAGDGACASIGIGGCARTEVWAQASSTHTPCAVHRSIKEEVDGVDFFDARTCEGDERLKSEAVGNVGPGHTRQTSCLNAAGVEPTLTLLPAWLLWYEQSSNAAPYYVNEETSTSCWELPPEAVEASRGWLRAWSEEHQAYFYANHWTGRVTWEMDAFEQGRN